MCLETASGIIEHTRRPRQSDFGHAASDRVATLLLDRSGNANAVNEPLSTAALVDEVVDAWLTS
jgi:hypothetical protein